MTYSQIIVIIINNFSDTFKQFCKMRKHHFLLTTVIFLNISTKQISAHPHLFIDVAMKFILSDSGLSGIYTYWSIDEMNSAQIIDYYDTNRNGTFEKKELIQILKFTLPNIQDMTTISWGLDFCDLQKVEKFNAVIKNKVTVVYSFFIPCNMRLKEINDKKITVFFEDPTIFIAFDLKKDLIQVSSNEYINSTVTFGKIDYTEAVILHLKRK